MSDEDRIIAEAVRWHMASTSDSMDWDDFTDWLEADERHRIHYDSVALVDDLAMAHCDTLSTDNNCEASSAFGIQPEFLPDRRRWTWAGGALAICLVAVAGFGYFRSAPDVTYIAGFTAKSIALKDGSHVDIAPHSRLLISADGTRIRLDGGAYFAIRHDPARTLAISAGPVVISDVGTRFDVQASTSTARIAVADGSVRVAAPAIGHQLSLERGQSLVFDGTASRVTFADTDPETVGEWRRGQLTYSDAPLPLVADDLARYAGVRVGVPTNLRDRRFTGTLNTSDGNKPIRDLAQLMGLVLVHDAGGYRLIEPAR